MKIIDLQWDDANIEHIARHRVNPQEVEDVCFSFHLYAKESEQRYILSGQTTAGRYLNIVLEQIGKGLFRPITAFDMSESYRHAYKKRAGQ